MSGLELLLEYLTRYFPILLFIFIALAFGVVTLVISYFVQPKYPEPEKLSAYECGFNPFNDSRMKFDVRFYLVSLLFIVFDLEVAFLFPWAVVFKDVGVAGFWAMMLFLVELAIGFVYLWRKGALEWD